MGRTASRPVAARCLEVLPDEGCAIVGGTTVWLTRRELEVLALLARTPGVVVPRAQLEETVWGPPVPGRKDRSLDVYIAHLRRRLAEVHAGVTFIHTHFGVGYRLDPVPHEEEPS